MLTFKDLTPTETQELGQILALCYRIARERARQVTQTQAPQPPDTIPLNQPPASVATGPAR